MVCNCVLGKSMVGNEHNVFVMVCVAVRICLLSEVETVVGVGCTRMR